MSEKTELEIAAEESEKIQDELDALRAHYNALKNIGGLPQDVFYEQIFNLWCENNPQKYAARKRYIDLAMAEKFGQHGFEQVGPGEWKKPHQH